ncbi:serine--glyoxylate aminotransferase, partial [Mesorhizobium sp. VK22B]|nr:serine--glyoxylate aminotransferase [Mesorhizobium sp. VK22B]
LNKVAGKVFRIGHLGWLNEVMVLGSLAAAELALLDCGVDLAPGSGVAAAIEHFRRTAEMPVAEAA